MIPPPRPFGFPSKLPGMDYVKDAVSGYMETGRVKSLEKAEAKQKAARTQAADIYEKRARERGR